MLIYNHKKEFLGIDEGDLNLFSLSDLAELKSYVSDFADLFVKAPGYVHNFKNIHWIDYVECGEENQKVIISIKDKIYSSNITIKTFYLSDEPSQKAYIVYLKGVKNLSQSESKLILDQASQSITIKPIISENTPKSTLNQKDLIVEEDVLTQTVFDPYDLPIDKIVKNIEETAKEQKKTVPMQEPKEPEKEKEDFIQSKSKDFEDRHFTNYVYNPIPASEELGLSVDVIEDFVQDFIDQANSFKDNLYESIKNHELSKLKIETDKLKAVAANLKIEYALEILTKISISHDLQALENYLVKFYKIIDNLSYKKPSVKEYKQNLPETKTSDDLLVLTFKDNTVPVKNLETESSDKIDNKIFFEDEFIDNTVFYDKKEAANKMGVDKDRFDWLFEEYLIQSRELVNLITKSAQESDLDICKNTAAKLKEISDKMYVHNFDTDLEAIINADETSTLNIISEDITSILDRLSNIQG